MTASWQRPAGPPGLLALPSSSSSAPSANFGKGAAAGLSAAGPRGQVASGGGAAPNLQLLRRQPPQTLRIRLHLDPRVDVGDAESQIRRFIISITEDMHYVSDLLHYLHHRLQLQRQAMTFFVDGFALLPGQRLCHVLRDGDLVTVAPTSTLPSSNSTRKKRRLAIQDAAAMPAICDAPPAPAFASKKAAAASQGVEEQDEEESEEDEEDEESEDVAAAQQRMAAEAAKARQQQQQQKQEAQQKREKEKEKTAAKIEAQKKAAAKAQQQRQDEKLNLRSAKQQQQQQHQQEQEQQADVKKKLSQQSARKNAAAAETHQSVNAAMQQEKTQEQPVATEAGQWLCVARPPNVGEAVLFRTRTTDGALSEHQMARCFARPTPSLCWLHYEDGHQACLEHDQMLQVLIYEEPSTSETANVGAAAPAASATSSAAVAAPSSGLGSRAAEDASSYESSDSEDANGSNTNNINNADTAGRSSVPAKAPPKKRAPVPPESSSTSSDDEGQNKAEKDKASVQAQALAPSSTCKKFEIQKEGPPRPSHKEVEGRRAAEERAAMRELELLWTPEQVAWVMAAVKEQVEFYFSDESYAKDNWLRSQADEEGWTSLELVAKFNRIRDLTKRFEVVLASLENSEFLEVSDCGYWIRRKWELEEPQQQRRSWR